MDQNQQQPKEQQESNIKKLKIPLIAMAIGGVLFVVLYKFFIVSGVVSNHPQAGQDSFQAPAELSSALQQECQASVDKMVKQTQCEDVESEFFAKVNSCQNYFFSNDNQTQIIAADGNYGDISLAVVRCYLLKNQDDKALDVLNRALELPDWDVYMGPITCDSKTTLEAQKNSIESGHEFQCMKVEQIQDMISSLSKKDFSTLKKTVSKSNLLQQGILDSDVSCPDSFKNIETSLDRLIDKNSTIALQQNGSENSGNNIYLEIIKNNQQSAMMKFELSSEGCIVFDSLLTTSSDSAE